MNEIINRMVSKFLGWKLPANFNPDCGISFKKNFNENTPYPMVHEPTGTNLFHAEQAKEMIEFIVWDELKAMREQLLLSQKREMDLRDALTEARDDVAAQLKEKK